MELYFSASIDLNDLVLKTDNFIHFLYTITVGLQQALGGKMVYVHVKKQYEFIQAIIWKIMYPFFECMFIAV
jgi:hypothetical protein